MATVKEPGSAACSVQLLAADYWMGKWVSKVIFPAFSILFPLNRFLLFVLLKIKEVPQHFPPFWRWGGWALSSSRKRHRCTEHIDFPRLWTFNHVERLYRAESLQDGSGPASTTETLTAEGGCWWLLFFHLDCRRDNMGYTVGHPCFLVREKPSFSDGTRFSSVAILLGEMFDSTYIFISHL